MSTRISHGTPPYRTTKTKKESFLTDDIVKLILLRSKHDFPLRKTTIRSVVVGSKLPNSRFSPARYKSFFFLVKAPRSWYAREREVIYG